MIGLYDGDFAGFKIATPDELDTALREAVVAVDANVLLDLYRFRPRTSQDLIKTLKGLGDRLVVPHQAIREFWRHRQRSPGSPRGATKTATEALVKSGRSMRDALDTWAKAVGVDKRELSHLETRVDDFIDELKGEIQAVLQESDAKRSVDSILKQLEMLLAGRITSPLDSEELTQCIAEAKRRIDAEEPPGFKDANKDDSDGAAGDYLVWYQATRYAKEQDRDLLIVTRDEKEDWWWRQQSEFIGPRPELALEYHKLTGRRLFLMRPSYLLERASVLKVEVDQESSFDAKFVADWERWEVQARHALERVALNKGFRLDRLDPDIAGADFRLRAIKMNSGQALNVIDVALKYRSDGALLKSPSLASLPNPSRYDPILVVANVELAPAAKRLHPDSDFFGFSKWSDERDDFQIAAEIDRLASEWAAIHSQPITCQECFGQGKSALDDTPCKPCDGSGQINPSS